MFTLKFIKIFHSVQEIGPFSLFQNLALGKASTDDKCHFAISWIRCHQYQCKCKILSKYFKRFKSYRHKCHFAIPWARSCRYQCVCKILSKYSKRFKSKISLFSKFEPRQNLDQSQMSFVYLMGYIMSISMCMQNFITIFHSVQEIGLFSLFQNLELGKASTDEKCHFAISWARSCQYQCLRNNLSKYSTQFKRQRYFHFFRIWRSAKPRPMINVISQSLGLDIININEHAKFYQNIPNGLRVIDIFHEQAGDKIFTNCLVTKSNVWL